MVYSVPKYKSKSHKAAYRWRIGHLGVYRVLRGLFPYLKIKYDQAQAILDNEYLISHHPSGRRRTEEEKRQLIALEQKIHALNKRGE